MRRSRAIVRVTAVAGCLGTAAALVIGAGGASAASPAVDLSHADRCDFIGQQDRARCCLLPFPDDYYTVADPSTATGPPGRPQDGGDAGERRTASTSTPRRTTSTTASAPARRSSLKVPGLDTAGGARRRPTPCRSTTSAATREPDAADRRDRRRHRQALADLGRDRLQRDEPGEHRAADPPGEQLRLRAPLHRRAAQPEDGRRPDDPGARGLPLLPRRAALRLERAINAAARSASRRSSRRLRKAGIKRHEPLPGLGLHGRQRREHRRADAAHARRRLRASSATPTSPTGSSRGPRRRSRSTDGRRTSPPAQDPRSRAGSRAPFTVPCYLAPNCAPGGTLRARRQRRAEPQRQLDGQLRLHHPARPRSTGRRAAGAPVALRPRPVRRRLARSASSRQHDLANDHDFVLCATDEIGMSQSDLANTAGILSDLGRLPEARRPPPAGPARTSSSSGRLMIHPDGFSSDAAFHVDGTLRAPSVIDTRAPLLRRQQPGRDHGRRADRGLARLHPRGARRAGDELLDCCCRARSTSTSSRRSSTRRYPDELSRPLLALADPDALGPRRAERLRAPDDHQPAARHAAAQGADRTSRSATTR